MCQSLVIDILLELLMEALPEVEEGEKFNNPGGPRLSTKIRNLLKAARPEWFRPLPQA